MVRCLATLGCIDRQHFPYLRHFLRFQYSRNPNVEPREIQILEGRFLSEEAWLEYWDDEDEDE